MMRSMIKIIMMIIIIIIIIGILIMIMMVTMKDDVSNFWSRTSSMIGVKLQLQKD